MARDRDPRPEQLDQSDAPSSAGQPEPTQRGSQLLGPPSASAGLATRSDITRWSPTTTRGALSTGLKQGRWSFGGALVLAALLVMSACGAPLGEQLVPPSVKLVNNTPYHLRFAQQWGQRWAVRALIPPNGSTAVEALPSPCFTTDVYALSDDGRVVAVHHPPLCNDEIWTIGPEATPNGTPTLVSPAPSYGPAATQ